jgi:hypothetical protein
MKLYHISQSEARGWDTFSDMVVCAHSEEDAALIHPYFNWGDDPWKDPSSAWCKSPHSVTVKLLGEAAEGIERGIVCSSFHAG